MRMTWAMAGGLCCSSGKALERAQQFPPAAEPLPHIPRKRTFCSRLNPNCQITSNLVSKLSRNYKWILNGDARFGVPALDFNSRATIKDCIERARGLSSTALGLGRRHVEGRIGVEESRWHPVESRVDAGLHRPVLRARQMVIVERVPNDDALIVEGAVGGGPARQAVAARMLVWILAGGVKLVGGELRRPEMLEH